MSSLISVWIGQSSRIKENRVLMGPKNMRKESDCVSTSAIIPTVEPHSSALSSALGDYPSTVSCQLSCTTWRRAFFSPWATPAHEELLFAADLQPLLRQVRVCLLSVGERSHFIRSSFPSSSLRGGTCFQLNANL